MSSLSEVLQSVVADDGVFRLQDAEGWTQGRTLFGGMTVAPVSYTHLTLPTNREV